MKLDVMDAENKKSGELEIADSFLDIKVKDDLIHDAVLAYLQNQHTGSSNTKTRAEVRGGGIKPWRQKGTGRARHGSTRSPIWIGGGITFGPRPLKSRISINSAGKKQALHAVLAGKLRDKEIMIVNDTKISEPKTKQVAQMLSKLNLKGSKVLLVDEKFDAAFSRAARNISDLRLSDAKSVNIYELLTHPKVVATKKAMEEMIRRAG